MKLARARRNIFQQRRFTQVATKRFRPLLFLRSEDFPEALELFRLRVAARGQGWDLYEGWRDRYRRLLSAPPSEIEAEFGPEPQPDPRRGRRRGRRGPPPGARS